MKLLFFSRGRGRGHAIPDIEIMRRLVTQKQDLEWTFVSYSTGAETIRSFGYPLFELPLSESNQFIETLNCAYEVIERYLPDAIIAHEEPAALMAAKLLRAPSIFLTDWFISESAILMQPLQFAESVLFMENEGVFDEPSYLKNKVQYLGPFVRDMEYSKDDRSRTRSELGLRDDAIVIACLPGGWATESRAPIADLLIRAFNQLPEPEKMLIWVAGKDFESLANANKTRKDIVIRQQMWPIEKLMVACDLIVTKGNRGTILEASSLGIPSISLSHGLNPIEDYTVPRISSNMPLRVKGLTSEFLLTCIQQKIINNSTYSDASYAKSGPATIAFALKKMLDVIDLAPVKRIP